MTSAGFEPAVPASERLLTHWTKATNKANYCLRPRIGIISIAALTQLEYVNAAKATTISSGRDRITDQETSGTNPVNVCGRGVGAGGDSMLCEG